MTNTKWYSFTNVGFGFFVALLLSAFIFLDFFGVTNKIIYSVFALSGLFYLLKSNKSSTIWTGFFVGIFWFYWISFSFIYYDLSFLIPFVVLGIGAIYAVLFIPIAFFDNLFLKVVAVVAISFIEPFNFNWFKFELLFVNSYFGIYKWQLVVILISLVFLIKINSCPCTKTFLKKTVALILSTALLFFALDTSKPLKKPDIKVALHDSKLPQDKKWNKSNLYNIVEDNLEAIDKAIKNKQEIIVLNESAFPVFLNIEKVLIKKLKELSKQITIVTGGLKYEKKKYYNSTYYFTNNNMQIVDKAILVPFGEEIPLPKFLAKQINHIFYGEVEDYTKAKTVTNITIKNLTFRNAICFEATKDKLFQNHPKHMIAISNNAWFDPSTQNTLQKILLKYYSKKYGTVIYHSANMGVSGVIM